jgi:fatty-acid desaturase
MKLTSKRSLSLTAAAVLLLATGGVLAHGGFGAGWGGHHRSLHHAACLRGFGAEPFTQARPTLDELKASLAITPQQEALWNRYVAAAQAKRDLMASHRQNIVNRNGVTPEQRFALRGEMLEQMRALTTAARDLYVALSPEQQAQAGSLISPR